METILPEEQPGFEDYLNQVAVEPEMSNMEEDENLDPELMALWESIKNENIPNYNGTCTVGTTLAQTSNRHFTWSAHHDCEWVHRRQRMDN